MAKSQFDDSCDSAESSEESSNRYILKEIESERRRSYVSRVGELIFWYVLAGIISARPIFFLFTEEFFTIRDVMTNTYIEIVFGLILLIFPFLFRLIFGRFPLESLRMRATAARGNSSAFVVPLSMETLQSEKTSSDSAEHFITELAFNSRTLARGLYSRSGVYLLIGVLIAFSGLAFFYLQTTAMQRTSSSGELSDVSRLVQLAPNFGILFFIEFIALFFLKQYKSAMDEFRYYEALQRSREETLAIVKLVLESEANLDAYELIEKTGFRSTTDKLEQGQTTELLESKKLNKDEAELFGKILDIIGKR